MSDLPYLPLWVAQYDARTAHLTIEEDGAYMRLLRLCWVTPGCRIVADDAWIRRMMRVDEATYERAVKPVLDEFFYKERGYWKNARLSEVQDAQLKLIAKRSAAGSKGGSAKALKVRESEPSKGGSKPPSKPPSKSCQSESESESNKASKLALADRIREGLGPRAADTVRDANIDQVAAEWLELGATEDEIVELVRRQTAPRDREPIRSLRALNDEIAAVIANRNKATSRPLEPLVIPEGKAGVCVAEIIARYGQERATAWLSGAEWTETELLLPSEFERARVEQGFGMILDGFGFTAGVRRARSAASRSA